MFRVRPTESDKTLKLAVIGLLMLSVAAFATTVWVMVDFLREQEIVQNLIQDLPKESKGQAEVLAGELRWQFRLSILIVLNLVVTAIAVILLTRAYRSSQESLRDIKALAADILSSMDLGILTTDNNGLITSINRRGMEIFDVTDNCVGHPLSELNSRFPLEAFRTETLVNSIDNSTKDFSASLNESPRTLRGFCQLLQDYEGNEIGNILQFRDVTERLLIEERLRRMERYMGLGSLAAGLHHEIKNPLAALSLHVQLLEEQIDDENLSAEVQQMLLVIKAEMNRVSGVLEGFRDFAELDRPNLAEVDLNNIARGQIELIAPQAKQRDIEIQTDISTNPIYIHVDQIRIEQVLLNLLMNAMEAMPSGGTLHITTAMDAGSGKIGIRDTGVGIPVDLQTRIFDPYFTTKSDGTGLGLALCDKIVRQHNGNLDFHSDESCTLFEVTLPKHR